MGVIRDKTIDVSNIKPEDKFIRRITGHTLSIQIDGDATLSIRGSHANFDSENFYAIAMVNMTTLEKVSSANTAGLYLTIVEGIDEIELEISGSNGVIHWKELGD